MSSYRAFHGWILILAFVLAACGPQPSSSPGSSSAAVTAAGAMPPATTAGELADMPPNLDGYRDLQPDQLQALLEQSDITLVNVHVPYEGELPNTARFIPFDQIQDYMSDLPAKDAPIVLYCRSGAMSTQAAKTLVGLGYTRVYELDGGFNAWRAAGYEVRNKQ